MKTLVGYIGRAYVVLTVATFFGALAFFSIFELADFARIASEQHHPFSLALEMTFINLGRRIDQVLPLAMIISLFILGTRMSRRGELVAMYAGGIRPLSIYRPVALICAAAAGLMFAATDYVKPGAEKRLDNILLNELGRWNSVQHYFHRPRHWYRVGSMLVRISEVDQKNSAYYGMLLIETDGGAVKRKIYADKVLALSGEFHAQNVTIERYKGADLILEQRQELELPLPERFNAFLDLSSRPEKMQIDELERVFKMRRSQGFNPSFYEVEYYTRIFNPFALVFFMFAAMTFALRADVKRSLLTSTLEMIGLLVFGFVITQAFRTFAISQTVSPIFGGLGPLLVAVVAAIYRARRLFRID